MSVCLSLCSHTLTLSLSLFSFQFPSQSLFARHSLYLSITFSQSLLLLSVHLCVAWLSIYTFNHLFISHSLDMNKYFATPFSSLTHSFNISLSLILSLTLSLSLALPPCLSPRCLSLSLFLLFVSVSLSPLFWVSVLSLILFTSSNFCLSLNYVRLISLSQRSVSTYAALAMALSGDNYILHCKCCLYWEERKKSEGEDFAICILFYLCYQFLFVTYPSSTSSPLIVFSYICLFFYASSYIRLHSYSTTSLLC